MASFAKLVASTWMLWMLSPSNIACALWQASSQTNERAQEEKSLKTAVDEQPGNVHRVAALGEFYLRQSKWRDSVGWLSKAYGLSGGDESIGYDLSFALMQAGDLDGARRQIEQMLSRSDIGRLHSLLGAIADKRKDYAEAAREYHRAAELDPSESNIFELATFLLQHKKYVGFVDESIKFFRYGVAQYPKSSQMMVGLGVALYTSQQYDDAIRVLCAAVDLDPTDRRPVEFLGKAQKVSPELASEVDKRLQDLATRYPENAATTYYYAYSLWQRGGGEEGKDLDHIEALLRKAETKSPGWYEPHYQLGVLYQSEKRYQDAIREMLETVKIEPEFAPAHYRLAMLYGRNGERAKAASESRKVQQIKNQDRADDFLPKGKER